MNPKIICYTCGVNKAAFFLTGTGVLHVGGKIVCKHKRNCVG